MELKELHAILNRLIQLPTEQEYVEFKVNNIEPEQLGRNLSALSNAAGLVGKPYAYLVFGIQDGTHEIVGTAIEWKKAKKGSEDLELWLSRMLNPSIDFRVFEFPFLEKNIVLIQIPAAQRQPTLFQHQGYIRIGTNTKLLRDYPEKERKIWQQTDTDFELEPAKTNLTAADVVRLLDTQLFFDTLLRIPYPTNQQGVIEKLTNEKMIRRTNGHFEITNLGAILFAKNLNEFDQLSRKAVRIVKYLGKSKIETERDTTGQLGYAVGFERMMLFLSGLLPASELIENVVRRQTTVYPPLALRELIANALIHQDFRERGTGILIEIFEDRIEIANPGKPNIEPNRFIDEFQSRNERLAAAMRRMGFCEEKGSGIDKVIETAEIWQLPAPDFQVRETHTKAILYAPRQFSEMSKTDKIRAAYQHCVLMYVTNQRMTNQSLRHRFKTDATQSASKIIKDTLEQGLIKLEEDSSSRKFSKYLPYWA